jgi:hypothetical protein
MAADFRCWNPAVDRCQRYGCGTPAALCFHWPGTPVDREPDRRAAAAYDAPKAPPPDPEPPPPLRAGLDAFALSPPVSQRPARSRRR